MVLIAPVWTSQSWLLEMLAYPPALLPVYRNLLHDLFNRDHPLLVKGQLQLAACKVSGVPAHSQAFRYHHSRMAKRDKLGLPVRLGQVEWLV